MNVGCEKAGVDSSAAGWKLAETRFLVVGFVPNAAVAWIGKLPLNESSYPT